MTEFHVWEEMVKHKLIFGLAALFLFVALARACDLFATCPYDGNSASSTGETRIEGGKTFAKYSHVVTGEPNKTHTFWRECAD
jgi:hypothetical protein